MRLRFKGIKASNIGFYSEIMWLSTAEWLTHNNGFRDRGPEREEPEQGRQDQRIQRREVGRGRGTRQVQIGVAVAGGERTGEHRVEPVVVEHADE